MKSLTLVPRLSTCLASAVTSRGEEFADTLFLPASYYTSQGVCPQSMLLRDVELSLEAYLGLASSLPIELTDTDVRRSTYSWPERRNPLRKAGVVWP